VAVLVDRAVEVRPAGRDLDVGLVDKPAVTPVACRAGRAASMYSAVKACTQRYTVT
jgi:hypothetical protein